MKERTNGKKVKRKRRCQVKTSSWKNPQKHLDVKLLSKVNFK